MRVVTEHSIDRCGEAGLFERDENSARRARHHRIMIVSKLYLMTPEIQHGLRKGRVMRFLR